MHIEPVNILFRNPDTNSVQEWIELVYMSRATLSRRIKSHYGPKYSPQDFIYELRIRRLKIMIESEPEITCRALAKALNLSPRHLMYFLARHLDTSFSDFRHKTQSFSFIEK